MKRTDFAFVIIAATILTARPLFAGVKVDTAEPIEKAVALQTADKRYITADTGGVLNGGAVKIGSKQNFTLIDVDGHDLQDGDTVRIRYTPHSGGAPDPSKASYWQENKDGIKRNRNGDPFKLKWVGTKCAFQAPSGKFVGPPTPEALLGLSDKLEGALLVELIDLTSHTPIANPKPSAAPATTPAAPPAPTSAEKPAVQ
jgi:hypothetical protein